MRWRKIITRVVPAVLPGALAVRVAPVVPAGLAVQGVQVR